MTKAIEEATTNDKPKIQQVVEKTEAEIKFEQIKLQRVNIYIYI